MGVYSIKHNKDWDKILITNAEVLEISARSVRISTKAEGITPKVIRCFLEHINRVYGIDLNIETEDMANERLERESKELAREAKRNKRVGRKSRRNDTTDF